MKHLLKRRLLELIPAVNGTPMPVVISDDMATKLARPLQDRSKYNQANTKGKR